jgi:hypothetical protein
MICIPLVESLSSLVTGGVWAQERKLPKVNEKPQKAE